MESTSNNSISVEIPNYSGPLETLLDLAKNQKVDLTKISITKLAENFLEFIKESKDKNLDSAFEYLIMATWLAYLKSKLLLPQLEDDDFKATEVAEKLKLQLKKLELIRLLSDKLLKKNRLGVDVRLRGMSGGIRLKKKSKYSVTLYELLKAYSNHVMRKNFLSINIPKLPVCTPEQAIDIIKKNINKLNEWKYIADLIPSKFRKTKELKQTGLAGFFAASLELTKEGSISIMQDNNFDKIHIKAKNG